MSAATRAIPILLSMSICWLDTKGTASARRGRAPPCTRWIFPEFANSRRSRRIVSSETLYRLPRAAARVRPSLPSGCRMSWWRSSFRAIWPASASGFILSILHESTWVCTYIRVLSDLCMVLPNVAPYKVFRKSVGERSLMVAVKNIARRLGDDISESKPIFDSRLPDGSRVAAVIPPCSLGGVTLTIRNVNTSHFNMEDLIREGTLDRALANHLEDYVLARKNVLICGGTGTGKSTLLSILGKFIPQDERVLVIEDTAELQLPQQNLVRFEARREQNGLPAVAIRDLLKAALRHRPDRIILGEVRGSEAFDLLQLLNTGHSRTLSTIPAHSAQQGLARFTSCVLQSGVELPYRSIKTNIADSVQAV